MDPICLLDIRNDRLVWFDSYLEHQRNILAKPMSLEQGIKDIISNIGRDIKVHKFTEDNIIIEIDYDKYTKQILDLIKNPGNN